MVDTEKEAFEDVLRSVARRTQQDAEIEDLGRALNIPSQAIQRAKVGNRNGKSHKGSLDLLKDWSNGKNSSTMRDTLTDALHMIKRSNILDDWCPEVGPDNMTLPTQPTPSETSGLLTDTRGDSSGQHDAEGPCPPSTPPLELRSVSPVLCDEPMIDKWENHTVTPAKSGPDESDREMQYVMWESLMKGDALIIGNADFSQPELRQRKWAEMDIRNMTGLLKKLGYDFRSDHNIHRNLSKSKMEETVKEFTKQLETDNPQSAVVYISSHGNEKGIAGSDGNKLTIPDLLGKFTEVLPGKPKVLIIDACWGGRKTSRLPVSASSSSSGAQNQTGLPENADIFMIHSTSYGNKTWSFTERGSWFVDELCKVVYNNDRDLEDLDTIMLRVTTGVHKIESTDEDEKDVGTQSTTVFKQGVGRKLFFYPGYPPTNV